MPPFRHGSAHDGHEVLYVLVQSTSHGRGTQAAAFGSIPRLFPVNTTPIIAPFRIRKGRANGIVPVMLECLRYRFVEVHSPLGCGRNTCDPIDWLGPAHWR